MKFVSTRLVTADIDRLLAFYAKLTGVEPVRLAPIFAEIRLPGGAVLAISGEELVKQFNAGAAVAASNRSAIVEFQVDDVDAEYARLGDTVDYAMPPTNMVFSEVPRNAWVQVVADPTAKSPAGQDFGPDEFP